MNQKFKNLGKLVLILCVTLLSTNCSNDELSIRESQNNIQTVTIDEAKSFLANSNGSPLAKSANKRSDDLQYDQIVQEKINGSDQLLTIIPFETNNDLENDRILLVKIDNEIKSVIFSMYPDENSVKGSFSGKIFIYSLEGSFLNGYRAENGIIVSQFVRNNTKASATSKQDAEALKEVIVKSNTHGIKYVNYFEFEAIWGSGGSSNAGGGQGLSWDTEGSGSGITTPTPAKIIDALTGKAKCLNDLLNKNGDSFVQNLLAKFQGNSKFDISIVSKDKVTVTKNGVTQEINGKTIPPVGNLITIEISTSKAEINSTLDVARTILHEYVHADIFRKLGTKPGKDEESLNFKTTYEAYKNQHSTIATLYLNGMKEALKKFHKSTLIDDYNKYTQYYGEEPSDAFYEALAWGGLKDANVKAWTDLPADKKAAIETLAKRVPMLSKTVPCANYN
ncbi:hypothetical protein [Flavobacterium sp. N1736]|uniref:hypothetical protein n=1 Tax=Flavobacterium sp. N1736 TaxID=2986823 RepID=UPI002224D62F|nr:hypothetical protein [Flavobacterium sp. N1736]